MYKIEQKGSECIKKGRSVYIFENRRGMTIIILNLKGGECNLPLNK